jgi:hypothetical protein
MAKNVLEFKLEYGEDEITPYAGLCMYGEMHKAIGLDKEINAIFPAPGSGAGFDANTYIEPIILTFIGGGKYIEDIRKIEADNALKKICKIDKVPGGDAIGDWLRRNSWNKVASLKTINDNLTGRIIKRAKEKELTLDIDAMEIEADKYYAEYTYNGNKGYMPLLGFIPEVDMCCGYEFRAGNVPPQASNYEFTKEIVEKVKRTGKKIKQFRSDSAGYQAKLINYLNGEGVKYTITADQDEAVKEMIGRINAGELQKVKTKDGIEKDREYAETVHTMNKTDHTFRLVVQRWKNPQRDLFENAPEYYYHVIATNYTEEEKNAQEVIWWHNGRSDSENYNKELKCGFNLDYLPCGELQANAVWFGLGILAYNLFIMSKIYLFPEGWLKKTITTVRWQFIQMAGRIIKSARQIILRVCGIPKEIYETYVRAREKCLKMQYIACV